MNGSDHDFARWLSAARAGSDKALGRLLEACRDYLLAIAQRELDPRLQAKAGASDIVQQTVLEAVRDFARFSGDSEPELLAWLRRLLLHNLEDFIRLYRETDKRQVEREVPLADVARSQPATGGLTPSARLVRQEQAEAIRQALAHLPDEYRQVLVLRCQEDRSFEDIGRLVSRSANAARKLWLRALERLQQELEVQP